MIVILLFAFFSLWCVTSIDGFLAKTNWSLKNSKSSHRTLHDNKNIISNDNDQKKDETVQKFENMVVAKGLTHIKQNKFAPTPEEAKNMTDEEFRAIIYKRMKEDERERRKKGPIGGAAADEYENWLNTANRNKGGTKGG